MINHVTTGFSVESAGAAISMAMGHASAFSHDAESVHIIVLGVFEIDKGWKAIVRIVVEPKVESKDENKPHHHHEHFASNDDKDKNKKGEDIDDKPHINLNTHIYVSDEYESFFDDIDLPVEFKTADIHFVAEGALWDNVQEYFPDIDFYEVVHEQDLGGHAVVDRHVYEYEKSLLQKLKSQLSMDIA